MTDLLSILQAALHGRYQVRRELDRGGMAIVYLADDVRHQRQVAIKVFQPELAGSVGADRFLREIQVEANLTHPHILPLYDSGDADGLLYYVMPFVQGETLRERLRRGPLALAEAARLAVEIADALSYAHRQGVVHRDIKPENIMLSHGHALVMDFGICRAVGEASSEDGLTRAGLTLGTPAYMSPEQWTMPDRVGPRTDIYSLGCVLYEMLVGEPPFTGSTPAMILARHTQQEMPSVRVVRPDVPESVEAVLRRALAKVADARYDTASDLGEDLQSAITLPTITIPGSSAGQRATGGRQGLAALLRRRSVRAAAVPVLLVGVWFGVDRALAPESGVKAAGPNLHRIAVLYFDDVTREGNLGYFADALTEDLIANLSSVRKLDVISRNGVAPFRDLEVATDSVARVLSAGTLVAGTVERKGKQIRVSLRLVEGGSGGDIKRANIELPAGNLLAIRDRVVEETSRLLRQWLGDEVRLRERERSTASVEAWSLVQRAEKLRKDAEALNRARQPGAEQFFDQADSLLARAEQLDQRWIDPTVMRGQIAYRRARTARDAEVIAKWLDHGFRHAERALALDRNHARALEVRGSLSYWKHLAPLPLTPEEDERLFQNAKADLEAAVELDPTLASAHNVLSYVYSGENIASVVLAARRAYEEDAYLEAAPAVLWTLFSGSLDLQQFAQAQRWCEEGARRFPDRHRFTECRLVLQAYPGMTPDPTLAWKLAAQLDSLAPEPQRGFYHLYGATHVAGALARAGQADSARSVLQGVRQRTTPEADPNGELIVYEAYIRTLLGDFDVAIDLLKRRIAGGQPRLTPNEEMNWRWRPLVDHPRFKEIAVSD